MIRPGKAGLILAGYAAALAIAFGVVALYARVMDGPERQASSGMSAFGDGLLFLAVFGVAAIPSTGAALHGLRSYRPFWPVWSVIALGIAATGFLALIVHFAAGAAGAPALLRSGAAYAILRVLAAPLFGLGFLLSGIFAPSQPARNTLLAATAIEAAVFGCVALSWVIGIL